MGKFTRVGRRETFLEKMRMVYFSDRKSIGTKIAATSNLALLSLSGLGAAVALTSPETVGQETGWKQYVTTAFFATACWAAYHNTNYIASMSWQQESYRWS